VVVACSTNYSDDDLPRSNLQEPNPSKSKYTPNAKQLKAKIISTLHLYLFQCLPRARAPAETRLAASSPTRAEVKLRLPVLMQRRLTLVLVLATARFLLLVVLLGILGIPVLSRRAILVRPPVLTM
jgi:hypothetical protein